MQVASLPEDKDEVGMNFEDGSGTRLRRILFTYVLFLYGNQHDTTDPSKLWLRTALMIPEPRIPDTARVPGGEFVADGFFDQQLNRFHVFHPPFTGFTYPFDLGSPVEDDSWQHEKNQDVKKRSWLQRLKDWIKRNPGTTSGIGATIVGTVAFLLRGAMWYFLLEQVCRIITPASCSKAECVQPGPVRTCPGGGTCQDCAVFRYPDGSTASIECCTGTAKPTSPPPKGPLDPATLTGIGVLVVIVAGAIIAVSLVSARRPTAPAAAAPAGPPPAMMPPTRTAIPALPPPQGAPPAPTVSPPPAPATMAPRRSIAESAGLAARRSVEATKRSIEEFRAGFRSGRGPVS
jgi:hypothetical protein